MLPYAKKLSSYIYLREVWWLKVKDYSTSETEYTGKNFGYPFPSSSIPVEKMKDLTKRRKTKCACRRYWKSQGKSKRKLERMYSSNCPSSLPSKSRPNHSVSNIQSISVTLCHTIIWSKCLIFWHHFIPYTIFMEYSTPGNSQFQFIFITLFCTLSIWLWVFLFHGRFDMKCIFQIKTFLKNSSQPIPVLSKSRTCP